MQWDKPKENRDQLVLFATRLDDAIPLDHSVRLFDAIMNTLDWSEWESEYSVSNRGRPPIHPRVMSSVLLYGLLKRIRSSRQLEESLQMRFDFRWLAEGRSIDHSTICQFRRSHPKQLSQLFVHLALTARQAGIVSLTELAFDGTRIRSSNSSSRIRKVESIQKLELELQQKFQEFNDHAEKLDGEQVTEPSGSTDQSQARNKIAKASAEIKRLQSEGKSIPKRLPLTDPDSRVTPNKEGGYAPNFTPTATVDVESGFVVDASVIGDTNEKSQLPTSLDNIKEQFGVTPDRVLADGIFSHGTNLKEMDERGIELYSPMPLPDDNPAPRDDPRVPVAEDRRSSLPTKRFDKRDKLAKEAFIYVEQEDVFYCPQGKQLRYKCTSTYKSADGSVTETRRYYSSESDCSGCPLRDLCIGGKSKHRTVGRDQYQNLRDDLAQRMATDEGKQTYSRRLAKGERPFAAIKYGMGVRQFLLRGLENVKQEWQWLTLAFNISVLMRILGTRAGPSLANRESLYPQTL